MQSSSHKVSRLHFSQMPDLLCIHALQLISFLSFIYFLCVKTARTQMICFFVVERDLPGRLILRLTPLDCFHRGLRALQIKVHLSMLLDVPSVHCAGLFLLGLGEYPHHYHSGFGDAFHALADREFYSCDFMHCVPRCLVVKIYQGSRIFLVFHLLLIHTQQEPTGLQNLIFQEFRLRYKK